MSGLVGVRQYLVDSFGLILDRSKARIVESEGGKVKYTVIPGRLSVCDTINGNRRKYPKRVWEKNLADGSPLSETIKRNAAFGLLEHPKDGHVDLNSPLAILTTQAVLREDDGTYVVDGEIRILNTPEGNRLCALIEANYRPTVSSRGYGTLTKGGDGIDEVQDDYVCEGWDVVMTPSFVQAQLNPAAARESLIEKPGAKPAAVVEAAPAKTLISESPKAQEQPPAPKIMDTKSIHESLASFRAIDPATLDAIGFAQGMARMNDLHNEVAEYVSEDRKRDWEGNTLHKAISALEESWAKTVTAPREENKKLRENQTKLLQIIKELGASALNYRTKLSEALKRFDKRGQLAENIAVRARKWLATSKSATADAKTLEEKYEVACEALDLLAAQYKEDVADLGARVLTLEFVDLSAEEKKLVESAKAAKSPQGIVRARKAITEKRKPAVDDKTKVDESKKTAAATKPDDKTKVDEAKAKADADAKAAEDKKLAEAKATEDAKKTAPGVEILRSTRASSVNETIAMTRRLSTYRAG